MIWHGSWKMLIERVVINASPLIVLFKSDQAMLFPQLFQEICLPSDVYGEIVSGKDDLASQQVPQTPWLNPVEIPIHPTIAAWDLGVGESSVLSFALANVKLRGQRD